MNNYNVTAAIGQLKTRLYIARRCMVPSKNKKIEVNRKNELAFNRRFAQMIISDLREYKRLNPELYSKYVKSLS